jgi:hypothetical protein
VSEKCRIDYSYTGPPCSRGNGFCIYGKHTDVLRRERRERDRRMANRTPCHYCNMGYNLPDGEPYPMQLFTVHDARGCVHVCFAHAKWRREQSQMGDGHHGSDCPLRGKT